MKIIKNVALVILCWGMGALVFCYIGIFLEVLYFQGSKSAFLWLENFPTLLYPAGMKPWDDYHPVGNRLGMGIGVLFGHWIMNAVFIRKLKITTIEEMSDIFKSNRK